MTFLNPLLLLGLAAAAIPLIIHLFNFRRPRKIDFSSLEFLKELQKSTMQRVRIKQLLLLLLRTLAIACLVLTFARPTLTSNLAGSLGGQASSSIVLVVDNSRSMQMRDAQGAYYDQAKEVADELIGQMKAGDEIYLLPVSGDGSATNNDVAYSMPHLAREAVQDLSISPRPGSISDAWARSVRLLDEATNLNKEIYVISDFQKTALVDSTIDGASESYRTYLLPIGTRDHANVAVTEVDILSRIIEVGQPIRMEAMLVNHGEDVINGYVASVFLEGERVAQATVDLEPGIPTKASFVVTPQQRGWLTGVVQIEEDAFTSDNIRHFTLNVPEQRQLLIVRGEGQESSFVELALSTSLTRGRVGFELETIDETDLPVKRLGTYNTVILIGPRDLSSGEIASLSEYVEEGGGVLFFPGEAGQAEDYNAFFAELGAGEFTGYSGAWLDRQPIASFGRIELEHPLFEGVFEQQSGFREQITVENPSLYYVMNYSPGNGNEQTLIQLSTRFPFLQEIRYGQGSAFVLAVAPDIRWSDLPQRGLFIPLLYRCMYYLSSTEAIAGEDLIIGLPSDLRISGIAEADRLQLVAPDGEEIVPEQRSLFGASLIELDASFELPGVYDVKNGEALLRKVAMNLDNRESDLGTYEPEEAKEFMEGYTDGPVRTLDLAATGGATRVLEELQQEKTGMELWNVFLLLALIFLVIEMLVARQWRPEAVPA